MCTQSHSRKSHIDAGVCVYAVTKVTHRCSDQSDTDTPSCVRGSVSVSVFVSVSVYVSVCCMCVHVCLYVSLCLSACRCIVCHCRSSRLEFSTWALCWLCGWLYTRSQAQSVSHTATLHTARVCVAQCMSVRQLLSVLLWHCVNAKSRTNTATTSLC